MDGLVKTRAKFTVDLHPSKLTNARAGVRSYLSSLLLRYNDDLDGVMLSYARERLLTQAAAIHPYFPFVRVEVAADIVLFRPRPGMQLVGTVNKVGMDYISLLVLGFINVSLAAEQIRAEFKPRLAEHCWVSSKVPHHRLAVGAKVRFAVASVRHHGQFMSIAGSLLQPGTGAEGFSAHVSKRRAAKVDQAVQQVQQTQQQQMQQQQQQGDDAQQSEKGQKKKKKDKGARAMQEQQGAPPPPSAEQHPQQPPQQHSEKKSKGDKRKDKRNAGAAPTQQPARAEAGGGTEAVTPAAAPSGGSKMRKDGKRKAVAEAAPAEDAASGAAEKHKKKKKKEKTTSS